MEDQVIRQMISDDKGRDSMQAIRLCLSWVIFPVWVSTHGNIGKKINLHA